MEKIKNVMNSIFMVVGMSGHLSLVGLLWWGALNAVLDMLLTPVEE